VATLDLFMFVHNYTAVTKENWYRYYLHGAVWCLIFCISIIPIAAQQVEFIPIVLTCYISLSSVLEYVLAYGPFCAICLVGTTLILLSLRTIFQLERKFLHEVHVLRRHIRMILALVIMLLNFAIFISFKFYSNNNWNVFFARTYSYMECVFIHGGSSQDCPLSVFPIGFAFLQEFAIQLQGLLMFLTFGSASRTTFNAYQKTKPFKSVKKWFQVRKIKEERRESQRRSRQEDSLGKKKEKDEEKVMEIENDKGIEIEMKRMEKNKGKEEQFGTKIHIEINDESDAPEDEKKKEVIRTREDKENEVEKDKEEKTQTEKYQEKNIEGERSTATENDNRVENEVEPKSKKETHEKEETSKHDIGTTSDEDET